MYRLISAAPSQPGAPTASTEAPVADRASAGSDAQPPVAIELPDQPDPIQLVLEIPLVVRFLH